MLKTMVGGWSSAFVSTWKTNNSGVSSNVQITVPTIVSGSYDCVVDWGDGSSSAITTWDDGAWTHTYAGIGTYTVSIVGEFVGIQFNNGGDRLKLLNISRWGQARLGNVGANFFGCSNLTITARDILDLTGTTTLVSSFRSCVSLNNIPSINNWDFTSVTEMSIMFLNSSMFNQPLNLTTTGSVTNFGNLLANTAFNSSITLNTTSALNMANFLSGATSFNQSIANIGPTDGVVSFASAFNGASAFNQPVSTLSTQSAANMSSMFNSCASFNQDVSSFDIQALTNATNMFTGSGFDVVNYDKLLDNATGWPSQATIQSGVVFSAGSAQYSAGAPTTGRAVLTGTYGWTITDGGPV